MKKLRLNLQQLEGVGVLSREEMKNVLGGVAPAQWCNQSCSCTNGPGAWYATETNDQTAADIAKNCPDGQGSCTEGLYACG